MATLQSPTHRITPKAYKPATATAKPPTSKKQLPKPPRPDMSHADYARYLGIALDVLLILLSGESDDSSFGGGAGDW